MYKKIMVPIDLAHTDKLDKALTTAADLSKHYGAPMCFVGVTAAVPSAVARDPEEFARKLEAFAAEQAARRGVEVTAKTVTSHDPARDLDTVLHDQIHALGVDLVVMASHVPGLADYLFASNAGFLAAHTDTSVFIVR